jgi:KAP family P-loop domain
MANPELDLPHGRQPLDSKKLAPGRSSKSPPSETRQPTQPSTGRWLYADKPLEPGDDDPLGFGAYADALALLMDWKDTSTPLTIAINGPWGSGKTSLAKMAEARLSIGSDWDAQHVVCWFDAWANDDAPHLGAAFAAAVATAANKQRRWWMRLAMPLPSVMLSPEQRWRRRLWLGILTVVLAAAAVFWPTGDSLLKPLLHPGATLSKLGHGTAATRLALPLLLVAVIALAQRLAPSIQGIARWIDSPRSEAARGSMQDASRQLQRLINQALRDKRRLMIFVDNLERCRPPRAVEVCEVVSQLIGHPEVVTVLIGDMDTIALSAEIKYAALESLSLGTPGTPGPGAAPRITGRGPVGSYGREYLEKLIQIQLRLPPPLPRDLRKMLVPVTGERPAFPQNLNAAQHGFPGTVAKAISARWGQAGLLSIVTGVIIAVTVGFQAGSSASFLSTANLVALVAGFGAVIAAAVPIISERYWERTKERTRTALDKEVRDVVKTTETALNPDDVQELVQRLEAELVHGRVALVRAAALNNPDAVPEELQRLAKEFEKEREAQLARASILVGTVRRRMRQRIISNTELRTELDRAVLEVLPLSPRASKRMFNHAHLLLDIGVERGIFDTQPRLQPRQLAAWVALNERWPSVAAAISNDPTLLGRLEQAAQQTAERDLSLDQLAALETDMGITGLDLSLLDYLRRSDSLVSCVRLLVNFSPDADQSAPEQASRLRVPVDPLDPRNR